MAEGVYTPLAVTLPFIAVIKLCNMRTWFIIQHQKEIIVLPVSYKNAQIF